MNFVSKALARCQFGGLVLRRYESKLTTTTCKLTTSWIDPTKSHKSMCALNKLRMHAFVWLSAYLNVAAPGCYSSAMFTRAQMIYSTFAAYDNVIGFSVDNDIFFLSAPCVKALICDVRACGENCAGSLRPIPIGLDSDGSIH
ncbi:hypothetical protein THRCLA_21046 [Thraustotheca clavata]|uniref:Uncharacterized protein n=1 Tax=Thraustotheca clavata TaxID=74557 RepID=A0A1W0A0Q0_9STRA|nr:hypothetical protein THRCLA_21046 [Thraustotheca clavata]